VPEFSCAPINREGKNEDFLSLMSIKPQRIKQQSRHSSRTTELKRICFSYGILVVQHLHVTCLLLCETYMAQFDVFYDRAS